MGKRARDAVHAEYGSGAGLTSDSGDYKRRLDRFNTQVALAQRQGSTAIPSLPLPRDPTEWTRIPRRPDP